MTDPLAFTIRAYREKDEEAINEMFNEVFSQQRRLDHWYWKYRDNPYGSHYISLAVSPEGRFAAHYAGYPVRLVNYQAGPDRPEETTICQLGDKMTRPEFRSIGFGRRSLMTRTFAHFRENHPDLAFSYGFLTHHSLRFGLLFLGYRIIEPVPLRSIPFGELCEAASGRSWKARLFGPRAVQVSSADGAWDKFFEDVAPSYGRLVRRNAAYVTWRYLRRPDRKYLIISSGKSSGLSGWAVFHREGAKIIWGDALFRPGDAGSVRAVLGFLCGHPEAEGAEVVECWFPNRPAWWDKILAELGFERRPEPNDLRFCITNFVSEDIPAKLAASLYYSAGDSDLF